MKKRILIINPGPLFPITMASQDRVVEMIKRLSNDHEIFLATLVRTETESIQTKNYFNEIGVIFYPIRTINDTFLKRLISKLLYKIQYPFFSLSRRYFYWGNFYIVNQLRKIILSNNFDIIQIEHWYQYKIFRKTPSSIIKVLSSHDILFEKKMLEFRNRYQDKVPWLKKRELKKYEKNELNSYLISDLVITISNSDSNKLNEILPQVNQLVIPIGKDILYTINTYNPNGKTILFYGSMGGLQNIIAFDRFYEKIYHRVLSSISDVKLLVVGANPPKHILDLHNGESVIVTGYMADPIPRVSQATVMILPLSTAGGFRGRVTDTLSVGIPVVGTHNALDCVDYPESLQCLISDDDEVLSNILIRVLTDSSYSLELSRESLTFVRKEYSVESTYGKLSKHYSNL